MNPTPQAVAVIAAYVTARVPGGWSASDAAILAAYNAEDVANPAPQATVPKPFAFGDVFGCLSSASIANVRALPTATDLIRLINAGDVTGIGHWLMALQAGTPLITPDEASAVQARINAVQPDPAWRSQVPQSLVDLGRLADPGDISAARAAGGH